MGITFPLPPMTMRADATAHPYPFKIGLQTEEFLQATVFYVILADLAAGQRVKQPGAIQEIENELLTNGMDLKALNDGWTFLTKYKQLFSEFAIQNAPIMMRNHWDWYIRRLGEFVEFGRTKCKGLPFSKEIEKQLPLLGKREMSLANQLDILRQATGLPLTIDPKILKAAQEMSLIRNLGLHNRWEVDKVYLKNCSQPKNWAVGEVRLVHASELVLWRAALSQLLLETWSPIAQLFVNAPNYPV